MRYRISLRDFCAGIIVGLLVGSTGLAVAGFGYDGWKRFSQDFKVGYIQGFLEMANLARNLEPGGYVDSKYPMVMQAKPVEWANLVDKLYQDPENQKYRMNSIMQVAAVDLEKKYGKSMDAMERTKLRMQSQLAIVEKNRQARALKEGEAPATPPKLVEAPEKKITAPAKKKEPKQRKWCRCDGKDPKAERAKRRAEAAAEKESPAKVTPPAPAAEGGAKTPPSARK